MIKHLIHVGFPKAGSKTLQHWFARHPQFAFTPGGIAGAPNAIRLQEIFGFGPCNRSAVTSYEGFVTPFRDVSKLDYNDIGTLVPDAESIIRVAECIANLFQSAQILIVTRGFREFCRSCYCEVAASGATFSCEDFCRCFFVREDGRLTIDYDLVVGAYERLFGGEKVLVLPFELLRSDPRKFTRQIETFAGVEHAGVLPEWLHRSPSPEQLFRQVQIRRSTAGGFAQSAIFRKLATLVGRIAPQSQQRRRFDDMKAPERDALEVPKEVLERFRGSAQLLKHRPFYENLGAEYLL